MSQSSGDDAGIPAAAAAFVESLVALERAEHPDVSEDALAGYQQELAQWVRFSTETGRWYLAPNAPSFSGIGKTDFVSPLMESLDAAEHASQVAREQAASGAAEILAAGPDVSSGASETLRSVKLPGGGASVDAPAPQRGAWPGFS